MLKKIHPKNIEQKEFRVFNPGDVKQAVEIPVKPKPSLEEIAKIAAALSNGNDRRISASPGVYYYELERNGKKIIVACAVGHLFTLSQIKKGSDYPVFDIEWKPNFEVRKTDFTKKYYSVIKKLVGD